MLRQYNTYSRASSELGYEEELDEKRLDSDVNVWRPQLEDEGKKEYESS